MIPISCQWRPTIRPTIYQPAGRGSRLIMSRIQARRDTRHSPPIFRDFHGGRTAISRRTIHLPTYSPVDGKPVKRRRSISGRYKWSVRVAGVAERKFTTRLPLPSPELTNQKKKGIEKPITIAIITRSSFCPGFSPDSCRSKSAEWRPLRFYKFWKSKEMGIEKPITIVYYAFLLVFFLRFEGNIGRLLRYSGSRWRANNGGVKIW